MPEFGISARRRRWLSRKSGHCWDLYPFVSMDESCTQRKGRSGRPHCARQSATIVRISAGYSLAEGSESELLSPWYQRTPFTGIQVARAGPAAQANPGL